MALGGLHVGPSETVAEAPKSAEKTEKAKKTTPSKDPKEDISGHVSKVFWEMIKIYHMIYFLPQKRS